MLYYITGLVKCIMVAGWFLPFDENKNLYDYIIGEYSDEIEISINGACVVLLSL